MQCMTRVFLSIFLYFQQSPKHVDSYMIETPDWFASKNNANMYYETYGHITRTEIEILRLSMDIYC